jgi:hypothetical protein
MSPSKLLIIHENYDHSIQLRRRQKPDHDIGLIKLKYTIPFSKVDYVEPVELPYDYVGWDLTGEIGDVAGFGIYSDKEEDEGVDQEYLRWISVPITSNDKVSSLINF